MALDPYQPCPCGSGKKIKFCCSDLIGEMEKIYRMLEGDQPRGALQHVEQTLARNPGRASLLDLKASLQQSLDMLDEAKATVEELRKCDPKSPIAHAQYALVASQNENPSDAVDALQTALELTDTRIPRRVFEAIGAVATAFMHLGNVVAVQAHLWLYQRIAPPGERQGIDALLDFNHYSGMPLLLRDQLNLHGLPEGHPVQNEMREIEALSLRGRWRAAAAKCDELLPDHLDEPIFFYNRALLSGFLGDEKNLVAGLRLYARQAIPLDDAIEAEAMAQYLDDQTREPQVQLVRVEFPVIDAEADLAERLLSNASTERFDLSAEDQERIPGPKPRGSYYLYDRPIPKSTAVEDLTLDQLPRELGLVLHFGRQTDRPERIEMSAGADKLAKASEALRAIVGELLGEETSRDEFDSEVSSEAIMVPDWWAPPLSSREQRRKWFEEARRKALLEEWPDRPRRALQDKTPREAASIDELQLPLAACVYLLEETQKDEPRELFRELRQQLGLKDLEPVDVGAVNLGATIPLARLERVDASQLDDASLKSLYSRAIVASAPQAVHQISREILSRESIGESMDRGLLFHSLFQSSPETSVALQVLDEARAWADSQGISNSKWDLLELNLHIAENNSEEADRVMRHLHAEHLEEPEVALQIYQLLQMLGVVDGSPQGHAPHDHHAHSHSEHRAPAPQVAGGGVWTPGADAAAEKGGSKIWTPD